MSFTDNSDFSKLPNEIVEKCFPFAVAYGRVDFSKLTATVPHFLVSKFASREDEKRDEFPAEMFDKDERLSLVTFSSFMNLRSLNLSSMDAPETTLFSTFKLIKSRARQFEALCSSLKLFYRLPFILVCIHCLS